MAFPPRILHETIVVWTTLKQRYAGCLIVLLQDNVYSSIGIDALALHAVANLPLVKATVPYIYFTVPTFEHVLHRCLHSGFRVVIGRPA